MTERQFQAAVIELAEFCAWRVYHVANVKGQLRSRTGVGFPDLTMARSGRLVLAELKTNYGKLTDEQKLWRLTLLQGPAEYYEWRPADWDEIENVLKSA